VGGLADAIADGETGLLVAPGDTTALRGAVERVLGDAALRDRLGAAARKEAAGAYSWAAATESLVAALESASRRTT
jgi:glycosyltransferase involved in cell wall biosynthesis